MIHISALSACVKLILFAERREGLCMASGGSILSSCQLAWPVSSVVVSKELRLGLCARTCLMSHTNKYIIMYSTLFVHTTYL